MGYFIGIPVTITKFRKFVRPPYCEIEPSKMHLTLIYLGSRIQQNSLELVFNVIDEVAKSYKPFKIKVCGLKPFPLYTKPKYLAAVIVNGVEKLKRLRERIVDLLSAYRVPIEDKFLYNFQPHITIATTRVKPSMEVYNLIDKIIRKSRKVSEEVIVKEISVYKSESEKYVVLHKAVLGST